MTRGKRGGQTSFELLIYKKILGQVKTLRLIERGGQAFTYKNNNTFIVFINF